MEEKRYCIFCGFPLEEGSDICPSCKKQIPRKENLFKEYLYRSTMDKLKGKVDDSLFSIVKNWLLSHLYGLTVSITFIGLVGIALSSPHLPSYVTEMNTSYRPGEQVDAPASQTGGERLQSGDYQAITDKAHDFTDSVFYYAVTGNGEQDVHISKYEDGPPPRPETYYIPETYDAYSVSSDYFTDVTYPHIMIMQGERMEPKQTTELGKALRADGFPVVEMEVSNVYKNEPGKDAPAIRTDRFLFVLVRIDGEWYIAETKLVGQEG